MDTKCEVIGWVLEDSDDAQVLVREENGDMALRSVHPTSTLGHRAIQTGVFRRGAAIIDPVTRETLGYEMECVSNPLAALAC